MSNPNTAYTDVLIVGAGPSGLMTALSLSRLGIKVRIIDRRLPGETSGQADGTQPRMIEIWDSFGIGEELRRDGFHVHKLVTYKPNEEGNGIKECDPGVNITVDSTPYPYEIIAPIEVSEGILRRALGEGSISVEEPVVPVSIVIDESDSNAENEYPIKLTLVHLNKEYVHSNSVPQEQRGNLVNNPAAVRSTEVVGAKYVVGCDGARSWVRRSMNIVMEGEKNENTWGVIDFTPITDFPTPWAKNIIQSPISGAMGFVPRPLDTGRMYILLRDSIGTGHDDSGNPLGKLTNERKIVKAVEDGLLPFKMELTDITWFNIYKVAQRVANKFSHLNRVFIVGDACHTHSPQAGQGANTSMTDACNLAWKLAYAIRGWAKPNILDTYEEERRPYSIDLIAFDKELSKLFNPEGVSPEEYTQLWKLRNMFTTGIGLRYSSSLIYQHFQHLAEGLRLGERVPPGTIIRHGDWNPINLQELISYDGKFKMLLFPGAITQSNVVDQWLKTVNVLNSILSEERSRVLEPFLVLNVPKETRVHASPMPIFASAKNTFVDDSLRVTGSTGKLYQEFGVTSGVVVLVRPDAHICMILPLEAAFVSDICKYLHSI
ncbi:hypothetical protein SERLA73DRAFT_189662 [Serpula lacrymans var. lacrymans S7.3]|uniref:FAD-binding domain-containing protein n=2 Tax=Serpula lacrymans var. lacrymans TaxID=341189 RepID=F8QEC2_SERL3|nr:uncharacterized protein SERLADRAFT_480556 [Serpula lacrymans var. lacrymans S7.9]EGN93497.1 hypothetical protein SERLA73DRAFT_189662 [Serpula lacrymans var. lacrymans S7.3]EGO18878.1 hypothetical protein SERLADRAFT_480556 [Serpula lacrymans var. lacrymans S7.9]